MRVLKVGPRPLKLLRAVEGIEVVFLPESDSCCGFGGTFAVKNDATSDAMVTDKAANVVSSGADFVVAGDASDRKSTRLNSRHVAISYAVFCLKKKKKKQTHSECQRRRQ